MSDEEIISLYWEQEESWLLGELYQRHKKTIYWTIWKAARAAKKEVSESWLRMRLEDLNQEAWRKILEAVIERKYQREYPFLSYSMAIAWNNTLDMLRKVSRRDQIEPALDDMTEARRTMVLAVNSDASTDQAALELNMILDQALVPPSLKEKIFQALSDLNIGASDAADLFEVMNELKEREKELAYLILARAPKEELATLFGTTAQAMNMRRRYLADKLREKLDRLSD
jgi:RNA polymerase sigma factor (sigma-70 family)